MNLRSLSQNKVPFSSNLVIKFQLHGETRQFFWRQNSTNLVSTCVATREESKTVEISWRNHRSLLENDREAHDPFSPLSVVGSRRPLSGRETIDVPVCLGVMVGQLMQSFSGRSKVDRWWPWEGRKEEKEREGRGKRERAQEEKKGVGGEKGEVQN